MNDKNNNNFIIKINNSQICLQWLAVLQSKAIPYKLDKFQKTWLLSLDEKYRDEALFFINEFEGEKTNPSFYKPPTPLNNSRYIAIIIPLILVGFYFITGPSIQNHLLMQKGAADASLILNGALYRTITALFLHGDYNHLASNICCLSILLLSITKSIPTGITLFASLIAASAGNLLNALFYSHSHSSIGASTAVFAILGIFGGFITINKFKQSVKFDYAIIKPLLACLFILSLLGSGGFSFEEIFQNPSIIKQPDVDIMAHLFGLISGITTGIIIGFMGEKIYNKKLMCSFNDKCRKI